MFWENLGFQRARAPTGEYVNDKPSNICLKKKIRAGGFTCKKNSCTSRGRKKKIVQAENPPPPPHHFSNGPSLIILIILQKNLEMVFVCCILLCEIAEYLNIVCRRRLLLLSTNCLLPRPLSVFHLGQSVSNHVLTCSNTSAKRIDREGLGESRSGTRQEHTTISFAVGLHL